MQQSEQPQLQPPVSPKIPRQTARAAIKIMLGTLWHQYWNKYKPENLAENRARSAERLRAVGVPEEMLSALLVVLGATERSQRSDEESHNLDRYLVGGCGILALVLIPVLASVSPIDNAVHVSWIAFAVSLPCIAGSLFLSFLRKRTQKYGKLHSWLSTFAIFGTMITATALIWHFWSVAGIVFLVVSLVVALLCLSQAAWVRIMNAMVSTPEKEPEQEYD